MSVRRIIALPTTLVVVAAGALAAHTTDSLLVSTAWLADRLHDPSLVIIHVGNRGAYDRGHIPGARFLDYGAFTERRGRLYTELPAPDSLERLLEGIGVSDDSRIILYQPSNHPTMAARLFVTLEYLDLGARTSMLNGGLQAWQAEGRPTSTDSPRVSTGSLTVRPRDDIVVDHGWVATQVETPSVAVLDARTPEFYTGEAGITMHAFRPGHIPGAGNVPFTTLTDASGRFKDRATLRTMFAEAGAGPGKRVVTYCHLGQQASLLYFVARYLGYEARMYDGSFEDWSARDDLPVDGPATAPSNQ